MPAQPFPNEVLGVLNAPVQNLLGTIVATTTKNNNDTAVPFNNTGVALKGMVIRVQPDAACYYRVGDVDTVTVTTSNGEFLEANEVREFPMGSTQGWIAFVSVSGTTNIKVWRLPL